MLTRTHEAPLVSMARCLLELTQELQRAQTRYDVAESMRASLEDTVKLISEDRKALEIELTAIAKHLGVNPGQDHMHLAAKVGEIASSPRTSAAVAALASERLRRMQRASNEIAALVARFEGSAAHELFCASLKRISNENLHDVESTGRPS